MSTENRKVLDVFGIGLRRRRIGAIFVSFGSVWEVKGSGRDGFSGRENRKGGGGGHDRSRRRGAH